MMLASLTSLDDNTAELLRWIPPSPATPPIRSAGTVQRAKPAP
jgi:hypothetical protein